MNAKVTFCDIGNAFKKGNTLVGLILDTYFDMDI